eukprot:12885894-Prorocentrum_lima.AAC.1
MPCSRGGSGMSRLALATGSPWPLGPCPCSPPGSAVESTGHLSSGMLRSRLGCAMSVVTHF